MSNEQIVICDKCNGVGQIHKCYDVGTHHSEYEYESKVCESCKGSGRLLKEITVEFKPYDPEKAEIKYDRVF
jgi:DnaJ-class molecular chaperone